MRKVPSYWLLSSLLAACVGSGETGDGCFSDFECASSSCSYGSCDSGLIAALGILADLAEEDESEPTPAPVRSPPPQRSCGLRIEAECLRMPGCQLSVTCFAPQGCFDLPGEELLECLECYTTPGCPAPCTRITRCQ